MRDCELRYGADLTARSKNSSALRQGMMTIRPLTNSQLCTSPSRSVVNRCSRLRPWQPHKRKSSGYASVRAVIFTSCGFVQPHGHSLVILASESRNQEKKLSFSTKIASPSQRLTIKPHPELLTIVHSGTPNQRASSQQMHPPSRSGLSLRGPPLTARPRRRC